MKKGLKISVFRHIIMGTLIFNPGFYLLLITLKTNMYRIWSNKYNPSIIYFGSVKNVNFLWTTNTNVDLLSIEISKMCS